MRERTILFSTSHPISGKWAQSITMEGQGNGQNGLRNVEAWEREGSNLRYEFFVKKII